MSRVVSTITTNGEGTFIVKNYFSLFVDSANSHWKLVTTFGSFEGNNINVFSRSVSFDDYTVTTNYSKVGFENLGSQFVMTSENKVEYNHRFSFQVGITNKYYVSDTSTKFKKCDVDKVIHLVAKTYMKFITFLLELNLVHRNLNPFSLIKGEIIALAEDNKVFTINLPKLKYTSKILDMNYHNRSKEICLQMEDGNTVLIRYHRGEYPRKIYNIVYCNARLPIGRNEFYIFKYLMSHVKIGKII